MISSTQKYLFQFFWVTDIWGHGVYNSIPTTPLFIPSHSCDWHILNLLKAQRSSIIDFPLFTLSGEGFLCGARGLPMSAKHLHPPPSFPCSVPGAQHRASNSSNGTKIEAILMIHHALDVGAAYGSILASNLLYFRQPDAQRGLLGQGEIPSILSFVTVWFLMVNCCHSA